MTPLLPHCIVNFQDKDPNAPAPSEGKADCSVVTPGVKCQGWGRPRPGRARWRKMKTEMMRLTGQAGVTTIPPLTLSSPSGSYEGGLTDDVREAG